MDDRPTQNDVDNLPALIRRAIAYADREAEGIALGMIAPEDFEHFLNAYARIEEALKHGLQECEEHHHHTCEWITPDDPGKATQCRICGRNGDA